MEYVIFTNRGAPDNVIVRAREGLAWADYDINGHRVRQSASQLPGCTLSDVALAQCDAEVPAIVARAQEVGVPLDRPLYIRWGRTPKSGRSKNHATGAEECGVSVYGADYDPMTGKIIYDAFAGGLSGAGLIYLCEGRPAYLITGDRVATGADGEPVITNIVVLAKLIPGRDGFAVQNDP